MGATQHICDGSRPEVQYEKKFVFYCMKENIPTKYLRNQISESCVLEGVDK